MFSCPECKKRFSFKTNLNRHRNGFHMKRARSCKICGKAFKRNDTLKNHEISGRCRSKRTSNTIEAGNCDNRYDDNEPFEDTNVDNEDGLKDIGLPGNMDCLDKASSSKFLEEGPSSLDINMYSLITNQVMKPRDKLKCYLKVLGHHFDRKRAICEEDESGDEANSDTSEGTHEENQSGNGEKRDIFGGVLDDSMESGEETNSEAVECNDELVDTDDDAGNEDDLKTESEESHESKENTLESADDEIYEDDENSEEEDENYEAVLINWPKYNVEKPWHSYGEKIVLFDQLDWLERMAASQSTLPLMKQIRHAAQPQVIALCEIALNLLMGHIPMTDEDFDCYKGQKDSLRVLANADNNWNRNRLLLGSNSTLVWILLVSIQPLYDEVEKPKRKRKLCSPIQTNGWKRYRAK